MKFIHVYIHMVSIRHADAHLSPRPAPRHRYTMMYVVVSFLGLFHPWVYGFLLLDLIIRSSLLKASSARLVWEGLAGLSATAVR